MTAGGNDGGTKDASDLHASLPDLTPDPSPKERGAGTRCSAQATPLLWRGVGGEVSQSVVPAGLARRKPIQNSKFKIQNSKSLRDLPGASQFKIQNSKFSIPAGLARRKPIQNSKFKIQNSKFKIQNSQSLRDLPGASQFKIQNSKFKIFLPSSRCNKVTPQLSIH
jgi:hypothetical protein